VQSFGATLGVDGTINTAVLLTGGLTMVLAVHAVRENNIQGLFCFLAAT
jgi:heme/copper-type cytochrome/quinol oxidase subunit 3